MGKENRSCPVASACRHWAGPRLLGPHAICTRPFAFELYDIARRTAVNVNLTVASGISFDRIQLDTLGKGDVTIKLFNRAEIDVARSNNVYSRLWLVFAGTFSRPMTVPQCFVPQKAQAKRVLSHRIRHLIETPQPFLAGPNGIISNPISSPQSIWKNPERQIPVFPVWIVFEKKPSPQRRRRHLFIIL